MSYRKVVQCPYCYEAMSLENFRIETWECVPNWEELDLIADCPKCGHKSLLIFRGSEIMSDVYHYDEGVAY